MSTPIQPVPNVVLASEFPSLADRPAGTYNAKAKAWADSENAMATRTREIALTAENNAVAAREAADEAVPAAATAVSARDTTLVYRDSAWAAAAAVQTSAGLPEPLVPGKVLGALSESSVGWVDALRPGDIIHCAQAPSSGWLPCDGSIYLKSSYPSLAAALGDAPRVEDFVRLPDLAEPPTGGQQVLAISPDGNYLACSDFSPNFLRIYKRNGDTFVRLTGIPQPTNAVTQASFSPDGNKLAISVQASAGIEIYQRSGDNFTKTTLPPVENNNVVLKFSPDGQHLYYGIAATPFFGAFKVSGSSFTKLPNPSVLPGAGVSYITVSPDGETILTSEGANGVYGYSRSGDVFTRISTMIFGRSTVNEFSPNGDILFGSYDQTGTIQRVQMALLESGVWVGKGDISSTPSDIVRTIAFHPNGQIVAFGMLSAFPKIGLYKIKNKALFSVNGKVFRDINGGVNRILFTPDGEQLLAQTNGNSPLVLFGRGYDKLTQFRVPEIMDSAGMPAFIKA